MHSLFSRQPRGNTTLRVILIVAALFLFGNMLAGMLFKIAIGAVALVINVVLFLLIVGGIIFFIRLLSGKAEPK